MGTPPLSIIHFNFQPKPSIKYYNINEKIAKPYLVGGISGEIEGKRGSSEIMRGVVLLAVMMGGGRG